jgi:hypothetical protein
MYSSITEIEEEILALYKAIDSAESEICELKKRKLSQINNNNHGVHKNTVYRAVVDTDGGILRNPNDKNSNSYFVGDMAVLIIRSDPYEIVAKLKYVLKYSLFFIILITF